MSAEIKPNPAVSIERPSWTAEEIVERNSLLTKIKAITIINQETYDGVVVIGQIAVEMEKKNNKRYNGRIAQAHQLHKDLIADKKADGDPIEEIKLISGKKVREWDDEQTRLTQAREAEERRIAAELQAEAEKAEHDRQGAERTRLEDEQLAFAAEIREAGGSDEEADAILEQPIYVAPKPVPQVISRSVEPTYKKAAGVALGGYNYSSTVRSLPDLVRFVVTLPENMWGEYLEGAETSLNSKARNQKDAFFVPGVTLNKEAKNASFRKQKR